MNAVFSLTAPVIISTVLIYAGLKGTDIYSSLIRGAEKGLRLMADILPALLVFFPAIYLFKASGLPQVTGKLMAPVLSALGIPPETGILMLLRPFSGSGALAAASEIIAENGADSLIGRTAAVMTGSSETSFYVIAVYFAAAGVRKSRWAIPAALLADAVCFISSALICRILWGP